MADVYRKTSQDAFGLVFHLTDIEIVGQLQKTSTGGLPDPFAVVYVDEEIQWESEAQLRTPTPHWRVDLRLSIRPSSTITIELRRRSMLFRFRHKTYILGQLAGQISELLENDGLLTLTDESGVAIGAHVKLKLKFISNPVEEATMAVDTHVIHATTYNASAFSALSGLAAMSLSLTQMAHGINQTSGTCIEPISQSLLSFGKIVSLVGEISEVHPICHAAWATLSSVHKDLQTRKFPDADVHNVAKHLHEMLAIANQCPDLRGNKGSTKILNEMSRVTLEVAFLIDKHAKLSFAGQILTTDISVDLARYTQHCQKRISELIAGFNARRALVSNADIQGTQTVDQATLDLLPCPQAQYDSQSPPLQDTHKEIVGAVLTWASQTTHSKMYWLSVESGIAETNLANNISWTLRQNGWLGGTFFFRRDKDELNKPGHVFGSIAYQLSTAYVAVRTGILAALAENQDVGSYGLSNQFKKLIQEPLRSASGLQHPVIILLDALDQYGPTLEDRENFLRIICDGLIYLPNFVKFVITSSPEPSLQAIFSSMGERVRQDNLTILDQSDIVSTRVDHEKEILEEDTKRTPEGPNRVDDKNVAEEEQVSEGPRAEPKQRTQEQDPDGGKRSTEDEMMRNQNGSEDGMMAEETKTMQGIVFPQSGEEFGADYHPDKVGDGDRQHRRKFERRHRRRHRPTF